MALEEYVRTTVYEVEYEHPAGGGATFYVIADDVLEASRMAETNRELDGLIAYRVASIRRLGAVRVRRGRYT